MRLMFSLLISSHSCLKALYDCNVEAIYKLKMYIMTTYLIQKACKRLSDIKL